MLAKCFSYGLIGLKGYSVTIETDFSRGADAYETVGLPDTAVKESRERVRAALKNSGFELKNGHYIVSLAPANIKKEGSLYDLPIALSQLCTLGYLPEKCIRNIVFLGELALDGTIRSVSGILPMLIDAKENGFDTFYIPSENAEEASAVEGIRIFPVSTLKETVDSLTGAFPVQALSPFTFSSSILQFSTDIGDIKGQAAAKRAAEIAVAGGHNLLLFGTPGSGKTMLARTIPSILPELTKEESLEITKIHSVVGFRGLVKERPFRAPHHGASTAALVGGGAKALPGEISMAHLGVLFLDEFPEFKRDVLESLRQPLEDGIITVSRAYGSFTYPASFILVAAMNPCPCGNRGSRTKPCTCTPLHIQKYVRKISGPLLDRIDIRVEMNEIPLSDLKSISCGDSSAIVRERVTRAREIQRARFSKENIACNSQMTTKMLDKYCPFDEQCEALMEKAFIKMNLSARGYQRVRKVARTIADLSNSESINSDHLAEALRYRGTNILED